MRKKSVLHVARLLGVFLALVCLLFGCATPGASVVSQQEEETHFHLTEDLLKKVLDIGPAVILSSAPSLHARFRSDIAERDPKEVDKVREACKVWTDPHIQAGIIEQTGEASEILREAGISPLQFTQSIYIIELALLRPHAEESREELEERLSEFEQFYRDLKRRKYRGPGLAQWELVPCFEHQHRLELKSLDLPESTVNLVERYRDDAEEFLTGNMMVDWMQIYALRKAAREKDQ